MNGALNVNGTVTATNFSGSGTGLTGIGTSNLAAITGTVPAPRRWNSDGTFAAALWPVAAVGLILTALFIALIYRREFMTRERLPAVVVSPARHHGPLVIKSVLVVAAMMVLFFALPR
jgi:hypothetical protein